MKNIRTPVVIVFCLLFGSAGAYAQNMKQAPKDYTAKDRHSIEALMAQKEKGSPQMDDPAKTIFILDDDKVIDWKAVQSLNPESVLSLKILYSYSDKGVTDRRIVLIKTQTQATATSKDTEK